MASAVTELSLPSTPPPPAMPVSEEDTVSLTSETSAAVVSLYQSWSSCASPMDLDSELDGDVSSLRERLLLRCSDLPPVPRLRPTRAPVCRFLNYLGSSRSNTAPLLPLEPASLDLGMAANDALFPIDCCPTQPCKKAKVRHTS